MIQNETIVCKNCNAVVSGNYCSNCGQSIDVGRITFKGVIHEIFYHLVNLDTAFLYTVKELTIRPGNMIKDYLQGKRKPYLKPFQYYFIMLALFFLLSEWLKINPLDVGNNISKNMRSGQDLSYNELNLKIQRTLSNNSKIVFSILTIMLPLALKIMFSKKGWSLIEYFVFALYVNGYHYFFSIISFFGVLIFGYTKPFYILSGFIFILTISYTAWAICQFFNSFNIKSVIRAVSAIILSYMFYALISIMIGGVISIIYFSPNQK